jgi:hypothetical protein
MPDEANDFERLKMLFEYTQFHIGLYATILGAAVAVLGFGLPKKASPPRGRALGALSLGIVFYAIAGFAGGVIAGNAPRFKGLSHFEAARLGPFRTEWMGLYGWTGLEHTAFWIGTGLLFVFAILYRRALPRD